MGVAIPLPGPGRGILARRTDGYSRRMGAHEGTESLPVDGDRTAV